jgi:hypothetical protein
MSQPRLIYLVKLGDGVAKTLAQALLDHHKQILNTQSIGGWLEVSEEQMECFLDQTRMIRIDI